MVIPASWVLTGKYSWLEEQALDVWDSLTAIGDVWTDKETWRLIFSRMSLALTPIVNWILVFSQEVTNRSQVFVDTVAPWFLSWSVWDAGLLGLLTAALGVLVWDFL